MHGPLDRVFLTGAEIEAFSDHGTPGSEAGRQWCGTLRNAADRSRFIPGRALPIQCPSMNSEATTGCNRTEGAVHDSPGHGPGFVSQSQFCTQ